VIYFHQHSYQISEPSAPLIEGTSHHTNVSRLQPPGSPLCSSLHNRLSASWRVGFDVSRHRSLVQSYTVDERVPCIRRWQKWVRPIRSSLSSHANKQEKFFLFVAPSGKLNPSLFPRSLLSIYFSAMPVFSHFEKVREIMEMTLPKPVSFTSPEEINVSS